jgi:hypothetical protein
MARCSCTAYVHTLHTRHTRTCAKGSMNNNNGDNIEVDNGDSTGNAKENSPKQVKLDAADEALKLLKDLNNNTFDAELKCCDELGKTCVCSGGGDGRGLLFPRE